MADTYLRNPGQDDYFTCPACLHNHHSVMRPGSLIKCEGCGVAIKCYVDQEPVSVCEIVNGSDDVDDD